MASEHKGGVPGDNVERAVEVLFQECVALLERGRELELASRELDRSDSALALAETEVRLRTTCCLANTLAWLAGQKAVFAGEITPDEAPPLDEPFVSDAAHAAKHRERLNRDLVTLERQARDLFDRTALLHAQGVRLH